MGVQLQKLRDKHFALARELVNGATYAEAGGRCGISEGRAAQIATSPLFKAELDRLRAEIDNIFIQEAASTEAASADEMKELVSKEQRQSLQTLINLRDDDEESGSVRQKSALEILQMGGTKTAESVAPAVVIQIPDGCQSMLQRTVGNEESVGECEGVGGDTVVTIEGQADENSQPDPGDASGDS